MPPTTTPLLHEGRYSIEQEFNLDGNRSLFQAYDIKQEEPVSIIEVPVGFTRVATASQREAAATMLQEQTTKLAAFRHKSAVAVRSCFVDAGRQYVVTDPVGGTDLASVLADQKHPFALERVTGWADTILDVLNGLHTFRPALVYRNIRPDCFVLREDGSAALTLFGMIDGGSQAPPATPVGAGTSTIAYSPLEQIWGGLDAASQKVIINKLDEASEKLLKQDLDARSDIYSLGASLYHLITGRLPVDALERSIEMIEDSPDPLKSPNKVDPAIPVEVSDVIMKAMEIRREYRFDSAAIMRQVLKTALVRVKEREAEEAREEKEILNALRGVASDSAKSNNSADVPAVQDSVTISEPLGNGHLSSGNPKRGNVSETFELSELEDDLLGLMAPSSHTSTPPNQPVAATAVPPAAKIETPVQHAPAEAVDHFDRAIPVVQAEPPHDMVEAAKPEPSAHTPAAESVQPAAIEEAPALAAPEPDRRVEPEAAVPAARSFPEDDHLEFYPADSRRSSKGLVAAAAAAVLCIAAVGGWFFMGSGPSHPPAASAPPPAVEQQTQPETPVRSAYQQPEPSPEETATTEPTPAPVDEPVTEDQPQRAAVPQPARQKKAPAKAPAQKKVVTVDDLINDN